MIPDSGKQTAAPAANDGAGKVRALPAVASRTAELMLELRVAALGVRFPALTAAAVVAVRSPLLLEQITGEIDIQRARRRHPAQEQELFLRLLERLRELRGERGSRGAA